jgi:hypothetical protein
MTRPLPARFGALLIMAVLLLAACGGDPSTSPSASASAAPVATATPAPTTALPTASAAPSATPISSEAAAAVYEAIEEQVVAIRGLKAVDVERATIDGAKLQEMNATSFDKDNPAKLVEGNDRLLKALGLIGADQSLRQLFLDLIDSQVAGFYRPDAKTLYVVSRTRAINGADKITFAHEYDHALQDANFPGVFAAQKDLLDQTDEAMARSAVYEGDATILMTQWAIPNMSPAELQDYVAAGSDPTSTAVLARTPQFLVDGLLFPYTSGTSLLTPLLSTGGWPAVDAVYATLPRSTEQVMHPEKYSAREEPIAVTIPTKELLGALGDGWSETIQDTFGEYQMASWLRQSRVQAGVAGDAAAGWGGDRLAVLDGPGDTWAVAMRTVWDSTADAAAFETAATDALASAGGPAGVFPGEGGTTRWVVIGSDDATLQAVAGAAGLAG